MAREAVDVSRTQVLAFRVRAHQLDRVPAAPSALAVMALGVQDTPYGSARLALAARTDQPVDDPALRLVWSLRGAPHLHRSADLAALAAALWPISDADATSRITGPQIKAGARLGLAAFTQTAEAFRDTVRGVMTKGEVSAAVSAKVDPSLTYDCRSCQARHISGALFQQAGLPGGVCVEPAGTATRLKPVDRPIPLPTESTGTEAVVLDYLRLLGPAGPAEVAKFLGTTQTHLRRVWPDDLVEVRVTGSRAWIPADQVDALLNADMPRLVRLLPPGDPLLQARDRDLVVPGKDRQSAVWRILGNPGAVLADGEVIGTWRSRMAGHRLAVTVTLFEAVPAGARSAIESEAARVATTRSARDVDVVYEQ